MEANNFFQSALKQQKSFIDASYNSMVIAQGHAEKMTTDFWKQTNLPKESIKTIETTLSECNKNRDNIKKFIDESYDKVETLFPV